MPTPPPSPPEAIGRLAALREMARRLKREVVALYLAGRDPRTPWLARAVALGVAAYALSPIDLIPDFIPVLGLLDDLILVPLGIALARRLIPPEVLADARTQAALLAERPTSRVGAVVTVWIALAVWAALAISARLA